MLRQTLYLISRRLCEKRTRTEEQEKDSSLVSFILRTCVPSLPLIIAGYMHIYAVLHVFLQHVKEVETPSNWDAEQVFSKSCCHCYYIIVATRASWAGESQSSSLSAQDYLINFVKMEIILQHTFDFTCCSVNTWDGEGDEDEVKWKRAFMRWT